MHLILITGLDGSGKSTVLTKLAARKPDASIDFILLPQIDVERFREDPDIYKTALFINSLGHQADVLQVPQLKAIALFASMLLFKKMLEFKAKTGANIVFCERHPLIDTGVYARFYAAKLGPGTISQQVLDELDRKYADELDYLSGLVPDGMISNTSGQCAALLDFIYRWFFIEEKSDMGQLELLFGLGLPDKIYYLKAEPEVLFGRTKNRALQEAHESVQVFRMLGQAYDALFAEINTTEPGLAETIDANEIAQLDLFFEAICRII